MAGWFRAGLGRFGLGVPLVFCLTEVVDGDGLAVWSCALSGGGFRFFF